MKKINKNYFITAIYCNRFGRNFTYLCIVSIISMGQTSPDTGWYDQSENEWIIVLSGYGVIEYINGVKVTLKQGDYLNIKAHEKHRVIETSPDK